MPATVAPSPIPTPGSPAYWRAQREAVALFRAWEEGRDDPDEALRVIRRVAAHGFARRLLTAHGHDVERLLESCEAEAAAIEAEIETCREASRPDPDGPPSGSDWCPRGCQPLFRMDCGMYGYRGRGVWADTVRTVAEYCCHCNARTYQSRDSICERCGKDAEGDDEPPPPASPPAVGPRDRGCTGTGIACASPSCPDGRGPPGAAGAGDGEPETAPRGASALDDVP